MNLFVHGRDASDHITHHMTHHMTHHIVGLRVQPTHTPDFCRGESTLATLCTEISRSLGVTPAVVSVSMVAASANESELAVAMRAAIDADLAAVASVIG